MTALQDRPATVVPASDPWEPEDRPRTVAARTAEDRWLLVGSVIGSLCLTWLLYEQVLPFSGRLGFVLAWYLVFVGMYSTVSALTQPRTVVKDRIVSAVVQGAAGAVGVALLSTVVYIFIRGFPAYRHLNFFTQDMAHAGPLNPLTQGGIRAALVGSLIEVSIAVAFSLPLALATAVFMTEVGGRFAKVVRTVVEAMTALPDLVAGLFVYVFVVVGLHQGRTGIAASAALAITMLPIIARSAEVVLRVVPGGLREASVALGASQWRTVLRVVLPTARAGLGTALILGVARGIGETAPVLIVSAPSNFTNWSPLHNPMNSLPLYILEEIRAPDPNSIHRGFGAAAVLLVLVIVLFVAVRIIARQHRGSR